MSKSNIPFTEIPGCLHDDPPLSETDKSRIRLVNELESSRVWEKLVSKTSRHLKLMTSEDWAHNLVSQHAPLLNWEVDWNNDNPTPLQDEMTKLALPASDTVYVCWMRELCVETTWDTFVRNWMNFLYDDEGCFVIPVEHRIALVFSNGGLWIAQRNMGA